MAAETPQEAFERGVTAGEIATRLADHDQHLQKINGSMDRVADELHEMNLVLQEIKQQRTADAATVLTTAAALEKAEQARRDRSESRWTPLGRLAVVVSVLVGAVGIVAGIYALTH